MPGRAYRGNDAETRAHSNSSWCREGPASVLSTGSHAPRKAELGRATRFSSLVAAPGHGGLIRYRGLSAMLASVLPGRAAPYVPQGWGESLGPGAAFSAARLILQPEIVIFMAAGRLAVGNGRHERGLAGGVATTTSAIGGLDPPRVRRPGRRTGAGSRCRSTG